MNDTVIRVENVSKKYNIGHLQQHHDTLRDAITDSIKGLRRKRTPDSTNEDTIWALKNISLNVVRGEVLGIIGRNGAGKSTLLKILSQITEPTSGRVSIKGRVGSLLEVGTGFHPELTGRENIYLNGTILGMGRKEIDRKFDEIVAFSDIEKFLDTPVKRYSSGMYVRLAFAVAAHLEPEILLVDEVLAVGDAAFQKKCLGKIGDISKSGRTILFVSHNMVALQSTCERVIWIDQGEINEVGRAGTVISHYIHSSSSSDTNTLERCWDDFRSAPGNDKVRIHRVSVKPDTNAADNSLSMRNPLRLEFEYWNFIPDCSIYISIQLLTEDQDIAFVTSSTADNNWGERPIPVSLISSACFIPGDLLNSGIYRIKLVIYINDMQALENEDILSFYVEDSLEGRSNYYGKLAGAVRPRLNWTNSFIEINPRVIIND